MEVRLAEAAVRESLRLAGRWRSGERYEDVGEYDPVLRSHCRLEDRDRGE